MVADAPTLEELWPTISRIIQGNHVVIYNIQFNTKFFPKHLDCAAMISCAMLQFAPIFGQRHPVYEDYTWQKLLTAADYMGYEWVGEPTEPLLIRD